MKDKVIATARGVLLIILMLSIPAILYAGFAASMVKIFSYAEHHHDAVESPFRTLALIIAGAITCVVVCGYGIIRLLRTRQKLDMTRALVFILALCLMWLGVTYLRHPKGRLARTIRPFAVTIGYQLGRRDFRGAFLSRAQLRGVDLSGADLTETNLSWANLVGADLHGADLGNANLFEANLREADLTGANMLLAVLTNTDLSKADLTGTNLTDDQLAGAGSLRGTIMPDGTIHE